jgi:hypothetical protein
MTRKATKVGTTLVQQGGYDPRSARAGSMAFVAPLVIRGGKAQLLIGMPLAVEEDHLVVDIAALATLMAGSGLSTAARRLALKLADPVRATGGKLTQAISSPPTQAQVQLIQDKVNEVVQRFDELLLALKRAQHVKEV